MTDCLGLCRLFERKHSNETATMGTYGSQSSKPTRSNNYVIPINNSVRRRSVGAGPGPLTLEWIDYCFEENGMNHQTYKYYCMFESYPTLVVRRGVPISFHLKFDRPFNIKTDNISFLIKLKDLEGTSFGNNTKAVVPLNNNPSKDNGQWSAYVTNSDSLPSGVINVKIKPPNNCIVGKWQFDVDTQLGKEVAIFSVTDYPFYILFNPWCPTDEVYMENDKLRYEYVLNEQGLMWRGNYNNQKEILWKYGQFEKNILEVSFKLLFKVRKMAHMQCNDPIIVARNLSAAVNAPDDRGVIQGNWTEDFSGGTPPVNWLTSIDILYEFLKTKRPVKYGQCWVFAGVLTTVCRALGIPCRPVTAYGAAHDTQNSLTIDYFVDETGKIMEELQSDSVWNYHVWNEVWMARPDLNVLDQSWQVIDATPQELSIGEFQCGPTSVTSVKLGEVRLPYDTAFVYSEVNADKVYWRYNGPTQALKLLRSDTETIGKLICTKMAGKWEIENITDNYKYPEKSKEERNTMHIALKQNDHIFSRYYLNEEFNDIKFDFELVDDIIVGYNFRVAVKMTNRGNKHYMVRVILRVDSVDYTGKNGIPITKIENDKMVHCDLGNNVEYVETVLTWQDYGKGVKIQNVFNISCLAKVIDTDFEYFAQDDFRVSKPDLEFKMEDFPIRSKEVKTTVTFKNPLPVSLRSGKFIIAGSSLLKTIEIKVGRIGAKETTSVSFKFTPKAYGKQVIYAKFSSNQLKDVDGHLQFMVK